MEIFNSPSRPQWEALCKRPADENPVVLARVQKILDRIRTGGDQALRAVCMEIEGRVPDNFRIPDRELAAAAGQLDGQLQKAIAAAQENIRRFHTAQMPQELVVETAPGVRCIQRPVPIDRVGLYIPGGTAPLFSTVLMLAVPARIAGCREIVLCTPAGADGQIAPAVLYAASCCGIEEVYQLGGAQAIAAMAYGTESIRRVDKIFGPGNQYVTTAKQLVGGRVTDIDMPAGPSEVMVIADDRSLPAFAAADLLSQAEHGRDSQVMLLCRSEAFAEAVLAETDRQLRALPREEIAREALSKSRIVILQEESDIVDFANAYAPEHLIISTRFPWKLADRIRAAGSIFIGEYTPESAGDYASGTNHTLPTCGWARSRNGVNLDSYFRKMTLQEISREGLKGLASTIIPMAEAEGLQAHANAVKIRIDAV